MDYQHTITDRRADGSPIDSKIFLKRNMLDKNTMSQIRQVVHHRSVEHSRFMCDVHFGKGTCVGFTSYLTPKIVPKYIGGDIGCGILTYPLDRQITDLPALDKLIRSVVPMGTYVTDTHKPIWDTPIVSNEDINQLCIDSQQNAYRFVDEYKRKYGINLIEHCPTYSNDWFINLCKKCDVEYSYILQTMATLGSGNHYVESNRSSNSSSGTPRDYITIHSGSRKIGDAVCNYHQRKINDTYHFDYQEYKHKLKNFERKTKDPKQIKAYMDSLKNEFLDQKHTDYLEGDEAYEYFFDMIFCQNLAKLNRRLMLKNILKGLNEEYNPDKIIESIHNYIDFNDFIVRKGAIAAHAGQKCIISLNMAEGILIAEGLGNSDWNYSSAHGSGRILARNEVSHKVSMKEFTESMKDVYSTSVVPETIDESPAAYKDTNIIKAALKDTVNITEQLKPILNVKAMN
jgi:RNA-splicing ligase RtcB